MAEKDGRLLYRCLYDRIVIKRKPAYKYRRLYDRIVIKRRDDGRDYEGSLRAAEQD